MVRCTDRFWEIDCVRGFAVLLMLLYHFLYDLDFFELADIQLRSGLILYAGRFSALLFILISGTALCISHSRALNKDLDKNGTENFSKYLRRGLKLYLMGLLLTGITWVFLPEEYIVFGILHFFGVSAGSVSLPKTSVPLITSPFFPGLEYCSQEFSLEIFCMQMGKDNLKSLILEKILSSGCFPEWDSILLSYISSISQSFLDYCS